MDTLFWTLDDYRHFLQHDDFFARDWAADRIRYQYPQHAAECFVGLLSDSDVHLRITASQTLGESGDPRYESALCEALPQEDTDLVRRWITIALGQLRVPALLPDLVARLDAAEVAPDPEASRDLHAIISALRHYPQSEVRDALRRFVARYPRDDYPYFWEHERALLALAPLQAGWSDSS